jgi:hypothetical protein
MKNEPKNHLRACNMCKWWISNKDGLYTMYTCYTTFWKCLSKIHKSIKQISKKAITHYVVTSIYTVSRVNHIFHDFKKLISKVSTSLTSCVHSYRLNTPDYETRVNTLTNPVINECVQRVTCVQRWCCNNRDVYVVDINGYYVGEPMISINIYYRIRRFNTIHKVGDDYEDIP